jgi:hypothetical protein
VSPEARPRDTAATAARRRLTGRSAAAWRSDAVQVARADNAPKAATGRRAGRRCRQCP